VRDFKIAIEDKATDKATDKPTDALTSTAAQDPQPTLFPPRTPSTAAQIIRNLQACLEVQRRAVSLGKGPFAAILIGPDNDALLFSHQPVDQVNHAESCLARLAYCHYPKEYLWQCTMYSTWEPCAMCTATIYWAHIGGIVYAASNEALAKLKGVGNMENFTMKWRCRDVLEGSQKDIVVLGPVEGVEEEVVEESDVYWSKNRG
jgi:tRNA(Arg) A34 adenosine deaminase TadA